MRLVVFIAVMSTFGLAVLFGLLRLVRELMDEDFFQAPSISADRANRGEEMNRDGASEFTNLTS